MGYFIDVLQKGTQYELDGKRMEFVEKKGRLFYFYLYEYDGITFSYNKTDYLLNYTSKEIYFIKRVQECSPKGCLRAIGRDRIFARN